MTVTTCELAGWLPIELTLRRRSSAITWMECGGVPLREPFFDHTVSALRAAGGRREVRTSLETLCEASDMMEAVPVAGFIFHISHCGSTLVSNAARAAAGALVISEAGPLSRMFAPYRTGLWPYPEHEWEAARARLLRAMTKVYAQRRGTGERRLIIKFISWNILSLAVVRRLWPDVPTLIVVRDPIEVAVATLAEPTMWMRLRECPIEASMLFGWTMAEVQAMSREEYVARAIAELCHAALPAIGPSCHVIDYRKIDVDVLCRISEWFNGSLSPDDVARVEQASRVHAKDPRLSRPHVDDRDAKQRAATPELRAAVERWARAPYERLARQPIRHGGEAGHATS